ncbi:MAG: tetratricopeptide repeat protein [Kiritimatiellae bacterium]|nr:tetratricopeptide repeat protein [Kiritimatiellia bacterium]
MDDDVLIPADLNAPDGPSSGGGGPSRGPLWAALVVVLAGIGLIFWLSRRLPDTPPPRPTPVPVTPTPTPDPALRLEAEALSGRLIAALQPLRSAAPALGAAAEWEALMKRQREGNQAMAGRDYAAAVGAYGDAVSLAEDLAEQLPEAPQLLFVLARAAVESGQRDEALAALDALQTLEPGHAAARALRPRAEVSDQTFAARERALDAMEREDWPMAFLAVNRAAELDEDFPNVRDMRAAVREQLADEVLDRDALRERERAELVERAEALEAEENWRGAHRAWLEAARVAGEDAVSAGLERTRRFQVLEERIVRASASLRSGLANDLAEELQALEETAFPEGLGGRVADFLTQWRLERTPVPVRFTSDAETEVRVLRMAAGWEPFVERTVEFLPGDYIAVGSRLGHRDVRVPFTVPPGSEGVEVDVRVEEGLF